MKKDRDFFLQQAEALDRMYARKINASENWQKRVMRLAIAYRKCYGLLLTPVPMYDYKAEPWAVYAKNKRLKHLHKHWKQYAVSTESDAAFKEAYNALNEYLKEK